MKLRKIGAVVMTSALVVSSLAACGSEDESKKSSKKNSGSFATSVQEGTKIENGSFSGSMYIKSSAGVLDDVEGLTTVLGDFEELSASITFEGAKSGDDGKATVGVNINDVIKADFIDVITVDNTYYIGVEKMVNEILAVAEDITGENYSEIVEQVMPEGAYLKITAEQFMELTGLESMDMGAASEISAEDAEKLSDLVELVADIIDKGIKEEAKSAYTQDGDTYKLTISKDNINDIVKGIAKVVSEDSENIAKQLKDIIGEEVVDAATLSTYAAMFTNVDITSQIDAQTDFEIVLSTSNADKAWTVGASVKLINAGESVEIGFEYKVKAEDVKIEVPTDLISDEDAEAMFGLVEQMMSDESDIEGGLTFEEDDEDKEEDDSDNDNGVGEAADCEINLNGETIKVGEATVQDFVDAGVVLESYKDEKTPMEDGDFDFFDGEAGDISVTLYAKNLTEETVDAAEAIVYEVSISSVEKDVDFSVMGDITLGSTKEELEEVFGEPTEVSGDSYLYEYEDGDNEYSYYFTIYEDVVIGITINNNN